MIWRLAYAGAKTNIPDLPGCIAAGETREETEQLIREAIVMHVEALRESNEAIPQPGTWTQTLKIPA